MKHLLLGLLLGVGIQSSQAFSLLGTFDTWQTSGLGYNSHGTDMGGPMNLGEEYRWNTPVIVYAFDESFLSYFGTNGVRAVEEAMKIYNNLPPVTQMSGTLAEYPLETRRMHPKAAAMGLIDLKSYVLNMLIEQLGLAPAERYVYTLRDRKAFTEPFGYTNYLIILRNFDPVTWAPSTNVNGVPFSPVVGEFTDPTYADVMDEALDQPNFVSSVSGYRYRYRNGVNNSGRSILFGEYFWGLTRDDVGGLRYLYRPSNFNVEPMPANTTLSRQVNRSGWLPVYGPVVQNDQTAVVTNTLFSEALRAGMNKVRFVRGRYESVFGQRFLTVTNEYIDKVVTNSTLVDLKARRIVYQPDIVFTAEDLGTYSDSVAPVIGRRSLILQNNSALNGRTAQAGPGTISGPTILSLTTLLPFTIYDSYYQGFYTGGDLGQYEAGFQIRWAFFDGGMEDPVIFPNGTDIRAVEQQILSGQ